MAYAIHYKDYELDRNFNTIKTTPYQKELFYLKNLSIQLLPIILQS